MAKIQNLIEDVSHSSGETNILKKPQELMLNSILSKGDFPSYRERHLYAWSKFLENVASNEYLATKRHASLSTEFSLS